ncbi:DUF6344 domain-containing protein [Streptomyces sp. DSM 41921]|uniref:DUF6344 domain-containing protein n=1 Tax=Streptomyces dubilierae TaxID=3075533 RepID=A0ABU2PEH8_9ACTN|nr:DUF6344 domain-containing protein [Streptomyces sp. DSM 41921]MDT0389175.1 DUF6344 domain-containing protein [Streptomyces sp. DSM 41921]
MARNKVMKLWTAIVTAFLALCTALGFITTTAAAAVPQAEQKRNSGERIPHQRTAPAAAPWSQARALPPTMKQRIRAEAHGKSPRCRHRSLTDSTATTTTDCADGDTDDEGDPATAHLTPLKR